MDSRWESGRRAVGIDLKSRGSVTAATLRPFATVALGESVIFAGARSRRAASRIHSDSVVISGLKRGVCAVAAHGMALAIPARRPGLYGSAPSTESQEPAPARWMAKEETRMTSDVPLRSAAITALSALLMTMSAAAALAQETPAQQTPAAAPSSVELAKEITNPVTSLWQLQMQFNNLRLESSDTPYNLYFQPVLPVSLTEHWNLITRPVFTLYNGRRTRARRLLRPWGRRA